MARKGKTIDHDIQSRYLNEKITLRIYEPESFSELYKYHICIMQDGNDYFQLGRVATFSDRLHEKEEIENTVFVGIHYQNRQDRWNKYHPNGKQNEAYMKFLVQEVVPLLDTLLPSYHMGQSRALMGDSLAGTLALMTAIQYPHTFGKVIMQSPYVNETVLNAVKNAINLQSIDIYHTIGTAETAVKTLEEDQADFLTPNRKLQSLLAEKETTYTYKEFEDGLHTWKYWQNDMITALTTMFSN